MDTTYEQISSENIASEQPGFEYHYGGFWIRFWSYLLDLIVIGSVNRLLVVPILEGMNIPVDDPFIFSTVNIMQALVFFLYFILLTKFFSQTIGKMVFGLKVVPLKEEKLSWGTVIFRELIGRFISKSIFNILYLIVAFTGKKQGLHDIFADTTVIHEKLYRKK